MTTLSFAARGVAWRRLARAAATWWVHELRELVPAQIRRTLNGPRNHPILHYAPGRSALTIPATGRARAFDVPIVLADGLVRNAIGEKFASQFVTVELHHDLVFAGMIQLPVSAEPAMAQVLTHQLELLVPLDPETLGLAWRIVERHPARGLLKVDIKIARKSTIEAARGLAERIGLRPRAIGSNVTSPEPYFFWVAPRHHRLTLRQRGLCRFLEIATVAIVAAAYSVHIDHLYAQRLALQAAVTGAEIRYSGVERASEKLSETNEVLFVIRSRVADPTALAVLDELTRLIPRDTWITEFHLQERKIQITGTAQHATAILGTIGASAMFEKPEFFSPITAAPGGGEQFSLGFSLRPSSKP